MTITSRDTWVAGNNQGVIIKKTTSATVGASQFYSLLDVAGAPGAGDLNIGNTTTGVVPTDATEGFPAINAFGAGNTGYLEYCSCTMTAAGQIILYDRLFHAGSFTLSTGGTISLSSQPSYASRLPATDYNGLEIWVEVNAAVSITATTCTATYTNEAGTTGRTTQTSASLISNPARVCWPLALQAGDKGVQKIDALNITGQAATSGSVNLIVARRLAQFDVHVSNSFGRDIKHRDLMGPVTIFADSALWPLVFMDSTASGQPVLFMNVRDG